MKEPPKGTATGSLRRVAVRSAAWTTAETWISRLLALLGLSVLARLLTPEDFGLVAAAGVYISIVAVLLDQGFGTAIIQRDELSEGHLNAAFWLSAGIGALLFGGTLVIAPYISSLLSAPDATPLIRALSVSLLLSSASTVPQALMSRQHAFRGLASVGLTSVGTATAVSLIVAFVAPGPWALVAQALVAATLNTMLLWHRSKWSPTFSFERRAAGDILQFSAYVFIANVCTVVSRRSDDLFISRALGSTLLGLYVVAYRFVTVVNDLIIAAANRAIVPLLARIKTDAGRSQSAIVTMLLLVATASFPVYGVLGLFSEELLQLAFGRQWTPASEAATLLAVAGVGQSITVVVVPALQALGHPNSSLKLVAGAAVVDVAVFAIVARISIEAVAAAYAIRTVLWMPLSLMVLARRTNARTSTFAAALIGPTVGLIIACGAGYASESALESGSPLLRVAVGIVVAAGAYVLSIRALFPNVWASIRALFLASPSS